MNLLYLKYFCDAVKQGSLSASAKTNFVTQSAISQGIRKLESLLKCELIHHQSNVFRLTKEGQKAFKHAQEVFDAVNFLENSLRDEHEVGGHVEFACTHSFALALLPPHLKKAKQNWPHLHVNFRLAHTDVIKELVKRGNVDFGFVLDNEDFSSFDCHEVYRGEHRLYTSSQTTETIFILSEERQETILLKKAYQKRYREPLPVLMEVSSWEVIANLVEEGLGIGFFPDYVAKRHPRLQEFYLEIDPLPYKVLAIFPSSRRLPKAVEAFLSLFKN